ncbi:filamentous hemagglutinin outer membrane protein [Canicola haemoglobinophilus]|uniref:Filamentous hemagglutinin outer membrane protein n=2 Tax=Canicola haemoglobinophilus TaxID=733 RepID=A0A377HS24_9PAST|nr:hemagglutinin repeat-containing protein [Canicola haemoglobinophilus]STO59245.1 filamentous hemagglutinin outer membrane protein [Canicola haemoglobinophilus]
MLKGAQTAHHFEEYHHSKTGSLAKKSKTSFESRESRSQVGSMLSGEEIALLSGNQLTAQGANIVANKDIAMSAKGDVEISAATNQQKSFAYEKTTKSGVFSGGGLGITFGKQSSKHQYESEGWTQSDARSAIGSLDGNVRIQAGNQVNITGSDLIAEQDKRIDIEGKHILVEAGKDVFKSSEKHEFKQSGLTLAVSSPAIDMAMKAQESLKRSNEVKNDKLSALYKIKAAQELLLAGQEAKDLAGTLGALANGDMKEGNISNPSVKISVSVGSSQSKQESHTNQVVHHGSELSAGNLSLKTTASDIDVIGSKLSATTLNLDSAKDIHLKSAQDSFSHRSQNNNSGWSAGVFVGASGNSYGVGLEASGYKGKGKENSDSTTQVNSLVQGKEVNISSQHDTALQGANVNADRLTMKVGNNLSIESRQDSNQYDSKQTQVNAGASVTLNGSGSASFNASRNKAKLNYAQVEEQSGLSAGEGGLAINVGNHTHLKGGLIESKAEESKNRLHTKTFSTEDIKNHSEVKVESHSVGLSTNMAQNAMSAVATTIGVLGNKNESKQSLTQSAVGNNIHFTAESQDEKTQQNLTALSRDTENANQKVQAYDLAEIKAQQEMAQVIGEIAQNSINLTLKPKLEEAEKQKAEAEAILANKETNANQRIQAQRQLDNANQTIQTYGQGGDMQMAIRAVTGLLQGIVTKNTGAAAVGLISPYANQFIKAQTGDNTTANLMAHALLGAIEAKATGTNALAGAAGALTGEAAAQIIAQKLYGIDGKSKTTNDLSESEKQTITALSQLAGGLAGGVIGDSTTSAVSSADIAKRAVENNHLGTILSNPEYASSLVLKSEADAIKQEIIEKANEEVAEEIVNVADKYTPHYISISGQMYGIGGKFVINLRNGDVLSGGTFSPLAVPSRIGTSMGINLGWITNLEASEMKNDLGHRITGDAISTAIKGTAVGINACYSWYCAGYGKSISSDLNNKSYGTFELGIGKGGSGGSLNEELMRDWSK